MEAWRLTIELWRVYRPVIADANHFDEEQDPVPEKLNPNPHRSEKLRFRPVPAPYLDQKSSYQTFFI